MYNVVKKHESLTTTRDYFYCCQRQNKQDSTLNTSGGWSSEGADLPASLLT